MFRHIVHSDWSVRAAGRWTASARREERGWHASGPCRAPEPAALVRDLFARAAEGPTLAAFDFPIGFPAAFGARSGYSDFRAVVDGLGRDEWPEFFAVAATPCEVGPRRPFYPHAPGGTRLRHLLDGHGVRGIDDLVRGCERAGAEGGSAGCMFWTLGAKQVGKAALHGWREVVLPARQGGARLWPFDGTLAGLARNDGLVLAESYPGDAYGQIGVSFKGKSKRDRADRASFGSHLRGWAAERAIGLDARLADALREGCPAEAGGDDGFDAIVGLLAAIAVAAGEREAAPPLTDAMTRWEGWILGKRPAPSQAGASQRQTERP